MSRVRCMGTHLDGDDEYGGGAPQRAAALEASDLCVALLALDAAADLVEERRRGEAASMRGGEQ